MFARRSLRQVCRFVARCEAQRQPKYQTGKFLNRVELIGYVARDPEVTGTTEKPYTKLSLGTTQYWRSSPDDDNLQKGKTQWHRIVTFNPQLQERVNSYVKAGNRLYIEGSLQYFSYVDDGGQKHSNTVIHLKDFINLTGDIEQDSH